MQGKSELSFRKTVVGDNRNKAIAKDLFFAYKASAGDTVIDLTALGGTPTEVAPKTNSSSAELQAARIWTNDNNLILTSSSKGILTPGLSYTVLSNTRIQLAFSADENEIITGQIRAITGAVQGIDGTQFSISGTLSAGSTDINLGQTFEYNVNPGSQHGNLVVEVEGYEMSLFRTINNDASSDGNFYEVESGGVFSIIRLTDAPFAGDRDYKVYSTGPVINLPQSGQQQQIDKLGATVDKLVETVAADVGVPETDFQAMPSSPDLKTFGDTVNNILNVNIATIKVQHVNQVYDPASMTASSGDLRFGSVTFSGDSLLNYDDSNGRFTALEDCHIINLSFSGRSASAATDYVLFKNGTQFQASEEATASQYETIPGTVFMAKDDYITINANNALANGVNQFLSIYTQQITIQTIREQLGL
jgi:hypothetical protein